LTILKYNLIMYWQYWYTILVYNFIRVLWSILLSPSTSDPTLEFTLELNVQYINTDLLRQNMCQNIQKDVPKYTAHRFKKIRIYLHYRHPLIDVDFFLSVFFTCKCSLCSISRCSDVTNLCWCMANKSYKKKLNLCYVSQ
jgi:hypothetical protein